MTHSEMIIGLRACCEPYPDCTYASLLQLATVQTSYMGFFIR